MNDRKLHIAVLVANLNGGGAERMMLNLAKGLNSAGMNVELVLTEAVGPYLSEVPENIKIIDLKSPRVLKSIKALTFYLKNRTPDVLISTLSRVNVAAVIARKLSGVKTKLLLREATTFSVETKSELTFWNKIINFAAAKVYPYGDKIIAISEGVYKDLIEYLKLPENKVELIHNPVVGNDIFEKAKEPCNHPWFNDKSTPIILGVGRINPQKDFSTLVKAFSEVNKEIPSRLMILGQSDKDDTETIALYKLIEELKISDKVIFPGFVQNPFSYFSHADLFVLSSRWEGLPGALIQAIACGCPSVSTDCPSGPAEIFENGKYGLLSPVGDYLNLANNIKDYLKNPPSKDILIKRSLDFSIEKSIEKYKKVFIDIM